MELEKYTMKYQIIEKIENRLTSKYLDRLRPHTYNQKDLYLLGEEFVKNNKNKGKFIFKNKRIRLRQTIPMRIIRQDEIKIKMILNKNISNKSYMFKNCTSLLEFSINNIPNNKEFKEIKENNEDAKYDDEITNNDKKEKNISNLRGFLYNCTKLQFVPDIPEFDTSRVFDMSYFFYNCLSLKFLPDIYKWKTDKVIDMSYLFCKCSFLLSLSAISKWNTINVTYMSNMFRECASLLSLPDISGWNTFNVIDINNMFRECKSIESLPDISKWIVVNIIDISNMFNNCLSLLSLPDLSKWNFTKVVDMSYIFIDALNKNGCQI